MPKPPIDMEDDLYGDRPDRRPSTRIMAGGLYGEKAYDNTLPTKHDKAILEEWGAAPEDEINKTRTR